jgi:UDP-N-acetylmuramoyl-L-alanyl-D-glutamate--2,6-diaminopimelate ligase
MSLTLGQLAAVLDLPCSRPALQISAITCDSRQVRPGALFVAYPGVSVDGHRYISQALAAGASAVVGEQDLRLSVPYLRVGDGRWALGRLAAAWEGFPSRKMGVIGVTGTDGKTTTSNILHSILLAAGQNAGLLTTVSARIGGQTLDTGLHTTTPDAPDLQRYLRQMADAGVTWAILETTSHGLSQWRVAGTDYDIAVFTNITHEHLDEHGDYSGYLAAKGRLLELLSEAQPKPAAPRAAVLNADDVSYARLRGYAVPRAVSYGIERGDVRALAIEEDRNGLRFTVRWGQQRKIEIQTPLMGRFNVYNSLAAITVAFLLEIDDEAIRRGLAAMQKPCSTAVTSVCPPA